MRSDKEQRLICFNFLLEPVFATSHLRVQNAKFFDCCMGQDDVVLGFLTPPNAGTDGAPLKSLFGFERVHVKSGETISVYLYPQLTDFTHVSSRAHNILWECKKRFTSLCSAMLSCHPLCLGARLEGSSWSHSEHSRVTLLLTP